DIVSGDTSGLACAAGTDGGVGDGYKDGKLIKIRLCKVQGIVVNSQISSNVDLLLNSARSAGINLTGGGFRTMESQIATRRNNCGSSQYDIYEKPSKQCSPDTARPGYSNHQMGLAIDLNSDGKLITSQSNKGFTWLAANASKFGLINYKPEPWHWSTDGK
ncbi:MAG: M15 family metallopeptidase, partial [Patescibacteria group bacterium]|nr:M15 family metallopeptidase [Patescibacteria group bacterium]